MFLLVLLFVGCLSSETWFKDDSKYVIQIKEPKDFREKVLQSPQVWVLLFSSHEPQLSYTLAPFEKAADHFKGEISFGAINCGDDVASQLCGFYKSELNEQLPGVLLFKSNLDQIGEDKHSYGKIPVQYKELLSAPKLSKWAQTYLEDGVLLISTDAEHKKFLKTTQDFTNRAIFFSEKSTVPNLLKSLALNFKVHIANTKFLPIVQASAELGSQVYGITKFPHLAILHKDGSLTSYTGALTLNEMKEFLLEHGNAFDEAEQVINRNTPPKEGEFVQIDSQKSFDRICSKTKGFCLLAFMDPADEANAEYHSKLETVSKKHPVPFGWINGPEKDNLISEFSLADGFPQLIAYFRSKKQVRYFRGGFDIDQLNEFISETRTARKRVATLDNDPAWDKAEKKDL